MAVYNQGMTELIQLTFYSHLKSLVMRQIVFLKDLLSQRWVHFQHLLPGIGMRVQHAHTILCHDLLLIIHKPLDMTEYPAEIRFYGDNL